MKDYIRVRGHNVSSLEVEREVLAHPGVAECACIGVSADEAGRTVQPPDVLGDEEIKLYVIPSDDESLIPGELFDFLAERLPMQMLPRFIECVPELLERRP